MRSTPADHRFIACLLLWAFLGAAIAFGQKSVGDEITEQLKLAERLQQQGEMIRANSALRQALGLTLEQLGAIYDSLGDLNQAETAYAAATEAKTDSDNALLGLGIVYLKKREFEKGIDTVKTLLAQKPYHATARHLLGKL